MVARCSRGVGKAIPRISTLVVVLILASLACRSAGVLADDGERNRVLHAIAQDTWRFYAADIDPNTNLPMDKDRKSTRLNSSHLVISYAVFCLKKKNHN